MFSITKYKFSFIDLTDYYKSHIIYSQPHSY